MIISSHLLEIWFEFFNFWIISGIALILRDFFWIYVNYLSLILSWKNFSKSSPNNTNDKTWLIKSRLLTKILEPISIWSSTLFVYCKIVFNNHFTATESDNIFSRKTLYFWNLDDSCLMSIDKLTNKLTAYEHTPLLPLIILLRGS